MYAFEDASLMMLSGEKADVSGAKTRLERLRVSSHLSHIVIGVPQAPQVYRAISGCCPLCIRRVVLLADMRFL